MVCGGGDVPVDIVLLGGGGGGVVFFRTSFGGEVPQLVETFVEMFLSTALICSLYPFTFCSTFTPLEYIWSCNSSANVHASSTDPINKEAQKHFTHAQFSLN